MPFPIAVAVGGAALQPASMAFFFEACAAAGFTKLGVNAYNYYFASNEALPTFNATTEEVTQAVHEDAGALVTAVSELLNREVQQSQEVNVRADTFLTTAEGHNRSLEEVLAVSPQEPPNHEVIHTLTEGMERQQLDIQAMTEAMRHLPELLKSRRDQQALMVENQQLKSALEGLEGRVSELTACMDEALALAEETQAENDALRQQLQSPDENKPNANASFSFRIFRP